MAKRTEVTAKTVTDAKVVTDIPKSTKTSSSKSQYCNTIKAEKPFNKSQISQIIAHRASISKKDADKILETLFEIIAAHLKKRGSPGEFTLPNIAKFKLINKPATKVRKGTNPFTGEPMTIAAKPARSIIKIKALKKIKDIVNK